MNSMNGYIQVIQPPSFYYHAQCINDTYVRSNLPTMNYGSYSSLYVGRSKNNDIFRSLLNFNISGLPTNIDIKSAKIVLKNVTNNAINIHLHEATKSWYESNVTYRSNEYMIGNLIDAYSLPSNTVSTEIDVTDYITDCYRGIKTNNGFIMMSADESIQNLKTFYSKEEPSKAPELIIEYKNINIPVSAVSLQGEIYITGINDIDGDITVQDVTGLEHSDLTGDIIVSNPSLVGDITVLQRSELDGDMNVHFIQPSELDGEITIHRIDNNDFNGEITIGVANDLVGDMYVLAQTNIDGDITVSHISSTTLDGDMYVTLKLDLAGDIFIVQNNNSNLIGDITIKRIGQTNLSGDIDVVYYSNLSGDIDIKQIGKQNLTGDITVKRISQNNISGDITALRMTNSELTGDISIIPSAKLPGDIIIRRDGVSNISGDISIHYDGNSVVSGDIYIVRHENSNLEGDIHIKRIEYQQLNGDILVKSPNELDGEIYIPTHLDLTGDINIKQNSMSEIEGDIDIHFKKDLGGEIYIKHIRNRDLPGEITIHKIVTNAPYLVGDINIHYDNMQQDISGDIDIILYRFNNYTFIM